MSASQKRDGFLFDSTPADPGRARPLTDGEFEQLADALESSVIPLLQNAAEALSLTPLVMARVKSRRGWAELDADWSKYAVVGRLRVDIHTTFALMVARKPAFWFHNVYSGRTSTSPGDLNGSASGRLTGFDDLAPFKDAIDTFVSVFLTAVPR